MEQQILRMESTLQRDYGDQDWSKIFRAGPDCIGILGECILITSGPKVMGIELKGPGLEYTTISANIKQCADTGTATFRKAARNMKLLAQLTDELSRPNGTIDTMLKFCQPNQPPVRDRRLLVYINDGENMVKECTTAIEEIQESFDKWYSQTKALHYALQDTLGIKQQREREVKDDIKKNNIDKNLKEEEKIEEEKRMKERSEIMENIRKKKEWYEDHAAKIAGGGGLAEGGIVAAVASAPAVVISGIGLAVAGATAYIHYRNLKADLLTMEEAQARRERDIRELELSRANLEVALAQLSAESKSIDQITQIVKDSIERVTELQQLIGNFMRFLLDISNIIDYTVKRSKRVYEAVGDKEGWADPLAKEDLLNNAFDMKTRFIFASRASDVYNAVSSEYILPTLDELPNLSLLGEKTDAEISAKIDELHGLRLRICSGTEKLTAQMHKQLKETLGELARTSARSFGSITSEDEEQAE